MSVPDLTPVFSSDTFHNRETSNASPPLLVIFVINIAFFVIFDNSIIYSFIKESKC